MVRACLDGLRVERGAMRAAQFVFILGVAAWTVARLSGAEGPAPAPAQKVVWNGYERINFTLGGERGVLVQPKTPAPGRPWLLRSEFFEQQPGVDLALLERGWHIASVEANHLYGSRKAMAVYNQFYAHLITYASLSERVVVAGFGRGALNAANFAATQPRRVAALYLDAPVLDIRSWPGPQRPKEWAECLEAHGLNEKSLAQFRGNPLDRITPISSGRIPVIIIAAEADGTVSFAANTGLFEQRYKAAGGTIQVIRKPGSEHVPHSLSDPQPVLAFLTEKAVMTR